MHTRLRFRTILTLISAAALCSACAAGQNSAEVTHDGLQLAPHAKMELVWSKPGEDFSQYSMIGVVDCYVAFKKDWQLNHPDLSRPDLDRARSWIAAAFRTALTARLVNSYPIAHSPGKNTLIVRPSLIELDVLEPHTGSDPDSITYTVAVGSAKLYFELYDSESGEVLLRAADRRPVNQIEGVEISSFTTNTDDAKQLLEHWADLFVDEINAALGNTND